MSGGFSWVVGISFALTIVAAGIGVAIHDGVRQTNVRSQNKNLRTGVSPRFAWSIENVGTEKETEAPITAVILRVNGVAYDVGTYTGSCFVIGESEWQYLDNEVTGVICWWAGGGSEVGVFRENGALVVKTGELDEGSAETPGFRGNFRTLFEL